MRKLTFALLAALLLPTLFVACNNYETYGEKKDKERAIIKRFLNDSSITVISETAFEDQGNITRHTGGYNEFVYLNNSGVYMQIVREGCGTPLQDGENTDLLIRFLEVCLYDTTALYNYGSPYDPDVMNVRVSGKTYTASFTSGLMKSYYSESVPAGWLVPLKYVRVGSEESDTDQISKVRLIVPHTQGHTYSSTYVYPYYYEITFQRK